MIDLLLKVAERLRSEDRFQGDSKGGKPLAYWGIFRVVERNVKKMP